MLLIDSLLKLSKQGWPQRKQQNFLLSKLLSLSKKLLKKQQEWRPRELLTNRLVLPRSKKLHVLLLKKKP